MRYEDDSVPALSNLVRAAPTDWNRRESSNNMIYYAWDNFLVS